MLRQNEQHLSDEELVLASGNELGERAEGAQRHLDFCARCRERAAEFEALFAELAHAETNSLESQLPAAAGARAMLRARISEMSYRTDSTFSCSPLSRRFLTYALGMATIAILAAVTAFVAHRGSAGVVAESSARIIRPNRTLTPGIAHQVSLDKVCSMSHEEVVKQVSPAERQKVFEEYGIPLDQADKYEVDYLVTPGLGGDDDIRNLWPEPYNAASWSARVKDVLEERLHEMVCLHQLDLTEAQRAIATDWIAAYEKYVGASRSAVPAQRRRRSLSLIAAHVIIRTTISFNSGDNARVRGSEGRLAALLESRRTIQPLILPHDHRECTMLPGIHIQRPGGHIQAPASVSKIASPLSRPHNCASAWL